MAEFKCECGRDDFESMTQLATHRLSGSCSAVARRKASRSSGGRSRSYGQRRTLRQTLDENRLKELRKQAKKKSYEVQPIWHMPFSLWYRAPQTKDLTPGEPVMSYLRDVEQAVKDIIHSEEFEQMVTDRVRAKHGGKPVEITRLTGGYNIEHCRMNQMERSLAKARAEKKPSTPPKYPYSSGNEEHESS